MKRYTIYTRTLIAAATLTLAAGCNELHEPDSPGKGMNIKPVFNTEITSSATKAEDMAESRTLEPLILDDGTQIDISVTKDSEWPIAGPECDTVLTKGTVYSGAAAYEAKPFRLSAWNATQSNAVLFSGKEYTCDAQHNWSTAQPPVWLSSSDNLAFVGVWDSSEIATASIVSGKYAVSNWDVSGNYADQKDLRAAFATYPADHNGDALLYFNPYMNAIRVEVGELPSSYSVTKVELKGVGVKGTLVFPDSYTPVTPVSGRDSYVGDWSGVTTGNLSLTGNWASGASVTPAGTAFLIIDPNGNSLAGSIEVTFKDSFGNTTVKSKNLSALGADVKCGEAFTINIGSTFNYTFTLVNTGDANQTFDNTTASLTKNIAIRSTVSINGGVVNPADFVIESVQIGSAAPENIDGASFSAKSGLSATIMGSSGISNLNLSADKRKVRLRNSNEYWTNKDGDSEPGWCPVSWEDKGVINLACYNPWSDYVDSRINETANCYVIRHAGTYQIPLVYGNALRGTLPSLSYSPYGNTSTELPRIISGTFLNHLGNEITSGLIEENVGCTAHGCSILWQDEADIIKDLHIVDTYPRSLQFTISQNDICQNNAVVAVKDKDNKIMWSWHIWTTNNPEVQRPFLKIPDTNTQFFPLPCLGWIDQKEYPSREDVIIVLKQKISGKSIKINVTQPLVALPGQAPVYQSHRKDPFCTSLNPAYGEIKTVNGGNYLSSKELILNPNTYYSALRYVSPHGSNLWGGTLPAETGSYSTDYIKTIFDPSPVDFIIPDKSDFGRWLPNSLAPHSWQTIASGAPLNNGIYFYVQRIGDSRYQNSICPDVPTIYFPFLGSLNLSSNTGYYLTVSNRGYYQIRYDYMWTVPEGYAELHKEGIQIDSRNISATSPLSGVVRPVFFNGIFRAGTTN